ncbi:hypothetical protein BVX98_07155 [bacterium F11]|nr:hypothetical protein BVX98_07155 [bacterium F11]
MLTVEDASTVSEYDVVIFADASVDGAEPFFFKKIKIGSESPLGFSSHHIEPEGVMAMAKDLFAAQTQSYVMGIRGYEFDEFGERLSDRAQNNLLEAIDFVERCFRTKKFPNSFNTNIN